MGINVELCICLLSFKIVLLPGVPKGFYTTRLTTQSNHVHTHKTRHKRSRADFGLMLRSHDFLMSSLMPAKLS